MNQLKQLWMAIRTHPAVSGGITLALVLVAANVWLWKERQAAALVHDDVRRRGEMMLGFLANRNEIQSNLAALREAQDQIDRNVVNEESKEVNLGYFYRLERATRVRLARIDQFAATPPDPKSAYKSVPVTLRLSGSYRNILGFLREVETGPRVMRIRQYQLERLSEGNEELQLALTLEMLARP